MGDRGMGGDQWGACAALDYALNYRIDEKADSRAKERISLLGWTTYWTSKNGGIWGII